MIHPADRPSRRAGGLRETPAPLSGAGGFAMRSCLYRDQFRWVDGRVAVACEEPLEVRVNGVTQAVLMRTPGHEVELAVGFCLTEGIIDCPSEVRGAGFGVEAGVVLQNVVDVAVEAPSQGGRPREDSAGAPRSASPGAHRGVCSEQILEDLEHNLTPVGPGPVFAAGDFARALAEMMKRQDLWLLTDGTHAVALLRTGGEILVVREDIGRHNAMDKAIGFALLNGVDRGECALMLSGRVSVDLAYKAVRAGFAVVAATSAATGLAVELADRMNCTLVGQIKGTTLTLYTHAFRVTGAEAGVRGG